MSDIEGKAAGVSGERARAANAFQTNWNDRGRKMTETGKPCFEFSSILSLWSLFRASDFEIRISSSL